MNESDPGRGEYSGFAAGCLVSLSAHKMVASACAELGAVWAAARACLQHSLVGRGQGWLMDPRGEQGCSHAGGQGAVVTLDQPLHPRMQHIKAIKKSSAQLRDFKGKYECKDTAFLDQRGEIAEGKLSTAGMSIRNRLIPQEFFFSFLSVL